MNNKVKSPYSYSNQELAYFLPEAKRMYDGGRLRRAVDWILRGPSHVKMTDEVNALILAGAAESSRAEQTRRFQHDPNEALFTPNEIKDLGGQPSVSVSKDPGHQIQPYFDPHQDFTNRHAVQSQQEGLFPPQPDHDHDLYA